MAISSVTGFLAQCSNALIDLVVLATNMPVWILTVHIVVAQTMIASTSGSMSIHNVYLMECVQKYAHFSTSPLSLVIAPYFWAIVFYTFNSACYSARIPSHPRASPLHVKSTAGESPSQNESGGSPKSTHDLSDHSKEPHEIHENPSEMVVALSSSGGSTPNSISMLAAADIGDPRIREQVLLASYGRGGSSEPYSACDSASTIVEDEMESGAKGEGVRSTEYLFRMCQMELQDLTLEKKALENSLSSLRQSYTALQQEYTHAMECMIDIGRRVFSVARMSPLTRQKTSSPTSTESCIRYGSATELSVLDDVDRVSKRFCFDRIFSKESDNSSVQAYLEPFINAGLRGICRPCIVADGQSGTGKSHTLFTGPESVAAKALWHAYQLASHVYRSDVSIQVPKFSLLEVNTAGPSKQEKKDLLAGVVASFPYQLRRVQGPSQSDRDPVYEIVGHGDVFEPTKQVFEEIIRLASEHRNIKQKSLNATSSRGHVVLEIYTNLSPSLQSPSSRDTGYCAVLDLAGSEIGSSKTSESRAEAESIFINSTRLELHRCLQVVASGEGVIPPSHSEFGRVLHRIFKSQMPKTILLFQAHASDMPEDRAATMETFNLVHELSNPRHRRIASR